MSPIPKNRRIASRAMPCMRAAHARQSSHFQKITGTLKLIFVQKICKYLPFTSKNNLQTESLKFDFIKQIVLPTNWTNLFLTCSKEKTIFFSFSKFLAFKQTKEHILFQVQPLKMLNKKLVCTHCRASAKIS